MQQKILILLSVVIAGSLYIVGQYMTASSPQIVVSTEESERGITVIGTGHVETKPDVARVTFGVETKEPRESAEDAINEVNSRLRNVVGELRNLEIKDEHIRTTRFSINPRYEFRDGKRVFIGYHASERINVKIHNFEIIGNAISAGATHGADTVGNVTFGLDDPTDAELTAQEEAIADARDQAQRIARALGVRLGSIITYKVTSRPDQVGILLERAATPTSEDVEVHPGMEETVVKVEVTYAIQ